MISQLLEILGDADDQRHADRIRKHTLSARKHSSMIPEVENESILEESILLEFLQTAPICPSTMVMRSKYRARV